eukprot:TRINITY_DN72659_c0_g1_i1.p1 TRINITY_DN72659_c0_g1~~TRINITY_DN72659_c0_g1_i1.p1  ORF type:complete len:395 (-),score=4.43 TRINITY_DN72659_c0_g1_i1:63-1157(-)
MQMKGIQFIALLILAFIAKGQWGPVNKIKELSGKVTITSSFTETSQESHHLVGNVNDTLYYLKMSPGFTYQLHLFKDSHVKLTKGEITGSPNGNSLFLAVQDEVHNVYFTESFNSGVEWKPLTKIIGNTVISSVSLLYVNESGRLFLFYTKENGYAAYITRPMGSSVWSPERILSAEVPTHEITAIYIKSTKEPSIVVGISMDDYLYTLTSTNMGATWSPLHILGKGKNLHLIYAEHKLYAFYLSEPIALTNRVFRYSTNLGETWTQRKFLEETNYYSYMSIDLCSQVNTSPLILAFSGTKKVDMVDTIDSSFSQLSSPSGSIGSTSGAAIICGQYDKFKYIMHAYIASASYNYIFYANATLST